MTQNQNQLLREALQDARELIAVCIGRFYLHEEKHLLTRIDAALSQPAQPADDSVKFNGIDDTLQMGRVRRLLQAQGIYMSTQFIAQLVEASQVVPEVCQYRR